MSVWDWRKPAQPIPAPKRGRPMLYDDEERAQRHREAALRWYRRNKKFRGRKPEPCYFTEAGAADREAANGTN